MNTLFGENLFAKYFDAMEQRQAQQRSTQILLATPEPEATTEALSLGNELGLPPQAIQGAPEIFRTQAQQLRSTTALRGAPLISDWLGDTINGSIAKDDLENLTWWEKSLPAIGNFALRQVGEGGNDEFSNEGILSLAGRRGQEFAAGLTNMLAGIPEGAAILGALNDRFDRSSADYADALAVTIEAEGQMLTARIAEIESTLNPTERPAREDRLNSNQKDVLEAEFFRLIQRQNQLGLMAGSGGVDAMREDASAQRAAGLGPDGEVIPAADRPVFAYGDVIREASSSLVGVAPEDNSLGSLLSEGLGSLIGMIAVALTPGGVPAGIVVGVSGGASGQYEEAISFGASEEDALRAAGLGGLIGATEIIPIGRALDVLPSGIKSRLSGIIGARLASVFSSGGEEAVQELLATIANNMVAAGVYDPERGILDGAGTAALVGAILGGGLGGTVGTSQPIARLLSDIVAAATSGNTAGVIDQIDEMAGASKVRGRSPERFQQALEAAGVDGKPFYVPAEGLQEYFQAKDVAFDAEMMEAWGIVPADFAEKLATGGDVAVPISAYAAGLSDTEDAEWFRNNAVSSPDEMSVSDAEKFNSEVRDIMQEAFDDAENTRLIDEESRAADVQIYDGMFSQLRAAGRSPEVAENEARVWSSFWRTMGERYGEDPLELARSMGVNVQGAGFPEDRRRRDDMDIMLNTLRAKGDKALKPRGPGVLEFVKSQGGVADRGGDVEAMDAPRGVIADTAASIRDRESQPTLGGVPSRGPGKGLDDLGRAMIEAGYFPEYLGGADIQDDGTVIDEAAIALQAITEALQGQERYAAGDGPDERLSSLSEQLSERGIDLSGSNDEIMAALDADEDGQQFDQDGTLKTDTPEFKAWFGDSKVVDANGDPLVVYHGSDEPIEGSFSTDGQRHQPFFFFTSVEKEAAQYGDNLFSGYIAMKNPLTINADSQATLFFDQEFDEIFRAFSTGDAAYGKSADYDGIIVVAPNGDRMFAVPEPNQIKSVNNRGTFDANDPLILNQSAVDSPAFQKWFGDSKVVDENGDPLVVYHGTEADIDEFKKDFLGSATGAEDAKEAFFFAAASDVANSYAERANPYDTDIVPAFLNKMTNGMYQRLNERLLKLLGMASALPEDGQNVLPVFLSAQNPLVLDLKGEGYDGTVFLDAIRRAKADGHDGVIFRNAVDTGFVGSTGSTDVYAMFEPTQIKSQFNSGTFDADDPRILYQDEAESLEDVDLEALLAETGDSKPEPKGAEPLAVVHNISDIGVQKAAELGGLAAPSLAVIRGDVGFENFGGISLVAKSDLIDPANSDAKVFNADVYSPRQPRPEYKISTAARRDIEGVADAAAVELGNSYFDLNARSLERGGMAELESEPAMILAFLRDQGVPYRVKMRSVESKIPKRLAKKLSSDWLDVQGDPAQMQILMDHFGALADERVAVLNERAPGENFDRSITPYFEDDGVTINSNVALRAIYAAKGSLKPRQASSENRTMLRGKVQKSPALTARYQTWLDEKFGNHFDDKFLVNGSRKQPYNLSNVVRAMTKTVRNGEGFNYGVGNIRSLVARQFNSLDQIKKSRSDIISKEDMERIKIELDASFDEIAGNIGTDIRLNDVADFVIDVIQGRGRLWKGASGFGDALSDDVVLRLISEFQAKLKNAPTEYFEAKMQRAVDFSEFEAAIVPKSVSKETVQILRDSGLRIVRYGKAQTRNDALQAVGKKTFFQAEVEFDAYREARDVLMDLNEDADISQVLSAVRNNTGKRSDLVDALAEADGGIEFSNREGNRFAAVSKSQSVPDGWRVTFFDEMGFSGHSEAIDKRAAVEFALEAGFDTEAAGALRKAMKERRFFQRADKGPRGSIILPRGGLTEGQTVINLFESANLSTFLHESGHFFLEAFTALADSPDTPGAMREDLGVIHKFLGIEDGAELTRDQHEKWARGFESYLMEGKAPSLELASAFSRFKAWLTRIYKTALGLNVKLTPQIREVMDRMLATDQEIAEMRAELSMRPLFSEAPAGMSPADFATYQKMAQRGTEQAEARLMKQTMSKVRRETEKWFKSEKAAVQNEITQRANRMPVYRATELLANKTWHGDTDQPIPDMQIDRDALVNMFGEGVIAELSRARIGGKRAIYKKGGESPELVAEMFGFADVAEMVNEMQNAGKRADYIAVETDRVMTARHGDPLNDGSIEAAAAMAVHSEQQTETVIAEARALAKSAGMPTQNIKAKMYRHKAREMLGNMSVREASRPESFLRAERNAARTAEQSFVKVVRGGRNTEANLAKAMQAKERQLLNSFLYRESRDFEKTLQRGREKMRAYQKKSVRLKLEGGYIEQIDELLERYDFRVRSPGQVQRTENLRSYIDRMVEEGREADLAIDPRLLDESSRQHYSKLSVDELQGLFDTIANIDHMGRRKNEVVTATRRRILSESASRVSGQIRSVRREVDDTQAKRRGNQFITLFADPDTIAIALDGGKEFGVFYDEILKDVNIADANVDQRNARHAEMSRDLYLEHYTKAEIRSFGKETHEGWTKENIISLALNMGTESNFQRVMDAKVHKSRTLTDEKRERLLATLEPRDWDFAQGIIDQVNSLWPDLSQTYERIHGSKLKKVNAKVMTPSAPASWRGGYYPISFDSSIGGRRAMKLAQVNEPGNSSGVALAARVQSGMSKERQSTGGGRTVNFSLSVPTSHIRDTIRYIELSEPVHASQRILGHDDVVTAFQETGSMNELTSLRLVLDATAEGPRMNDDFFNATARAVKTNFVLSRLALNFKTVLLQVTGLPQSSAIVGHSYMAKATAKYFSSPLGIKAEADRVRSLSPIMERRFTLFQRDLYDIRNQIETSSPVKGKIGTTRDWLSEVGMAPIQFIQFWVVDMPTWLAAHQRGKDEGNSESDAIHFADRLVERAQDTARTPTRSMVELGSTSMSYQQSDVIKTFTTLGGYMFNKFNRMRVEALRLQFGLKGDISTAQKVQLSMIAAANLTILLSAEAVMMTAIYGLMSDDEEDMGELAAFAGKESLSAFSGGVLFARDFWGKAQGFEAGLYGSVAGDVAGAFEQTAQGEMDVAMFKSYLNLIGTATGLPTTFVSRMASFFSEPNEISFMESLMGKNPLRYE